MWETGARSDVWTLRAYCSYFNAAGQFLELEPGMPVTDLMMKLAGGCANVPDWEPRLVRIEGMVLGHEEAIIALEKPPRPLKSSKSS